MCLKSAIIAALCGSTFVSSPAFGQGSLISRADTRIGAQAPFIQSTNPGAPRRSGSVNGGFLCTYQFFFNNLSPYQGSVGSKNNSDPVCATYVFRFSVKHWSPITPANALILAHGTVTGGAAAFGLERQSFPRAGHRGSFYSSVTPNADGLNDLYRFSNSERPAAVF